MKISSFGMNPSNVVMRRMFCGFLKGCSLPEISAAPVTTPKSFPSAVPVTPTPLPRAAPTPVATQQDRTVQVSGVQKFMVKKMVEVNAVPQFGYGDEICMDRLMEVRSALKLIGTYQGGLFRNDVFFVAYFLRGTVWSEIELSAFYS